MARARLCRLEFRLCRASALVLETHLPQGTQQGSSLNDFLVFGTMAVGSFFFRPVARELRLVGGEPRGLSAGAARALWCWRSPPLPGGGGPVCKRWQNFPTRPFNHWSAFFGGRMPSRARLDEFHRNRRIRRYARHRFDEIAWQEWRGDKIFRERFFYDPTKVST